MTNNAEREAFEMARIAYLRETHIWPRISGLRAAIEAWQARAQASGVPDGKDAVNEIVSFVQTGTVVANGDIGSVLMWLRKDMIGKVVYLYDHFPLRTHPTEVRQRASGEVGGFNKVRRLL